MSALRLFPVLLFLAALALLGAAPSAATVAQYQKRLAKLKPDDPKALAELAAWCLSSGLKGDGEGLYRKLLEKDPEHAAARKALGFVKVGTEWLTHPEKKHREEKIKLEAEAAKVQEGDAAALLKLAERSRKAGLPDLSKALLERVLATEPDHAAARRLLRFSRFEGAWTEDDSLLKDYVAAASDEGRKAIAEALKVSGSGLTAERLEQHRRWAAAPKGMQEKLPLKGKAYETYYHLSVPEGYSGLERIPLVFYLHGGGVGQGEPNDIIALRRFTDPKGWIMVCPSAPNRDRDGVRMWCQGEGEACVLDLIARLSEQYAIDPRRIYLTGGSAGGWGTLHIGAKHPDLFAALGAECPEAGNADAQKLSKLPLYIVHGSEDHVCEVERVRALHAQLLGLGAVHRYVEVAGAGHDLPQESPGELFGWIAAFSLPEPKVSKK